MKNIFIIIIILVLFFPLFLYAGEKPIISVLDFHTDEGISVNEMKVYISLLTSALFKTGVYTVIDVSERERLLSELEFSVSDCSDESCQLEIGKLLAAEAIVIGRIGRLGSRYILTVKMLETDTGRAINTADGVYENLDDMVDNVKNIAGEIASVHIKEEIPVVKDTEEKIVQPEEPGPVPEDMVYVGGGTFLMGKSSGPDDEKPAHEVKLGSFYMMKYEVTQKQWREVMGSNPSHFKGDNLPVENVSFNDVIIFCNRLSEKEGLTPCYSGSGENIACDFSANGYRLPTEAEWEFAARGGNKSKGYKYAGSDTIGSVAWFLGNSGDKTHPVGTKAANELGLYDMSGNVWEWCWDYYGKYDASAVTDPTGPLKGFARIKRGGSWVLLEEGCYITNRHNGGANGRSSSVGFRVVRKKEK